MILAFVVGAAALLVGAALGYYTACQDQERAQQKPEKCGSVNRRWSVRCQRHPLHEGRHYHYIEGTGNGDEKWIEWNSEEESF